jgi:D-beta-D-heptose 7-phosphate kinase/D-beta-D-heptose 1-phosphate adenosyltransferase
VKDKKTVWTNGCFDVIHRGHIELLKFCKSIGGHVVVGLNSDESVQKNKGKDRPIFCQADRAEVLKSIKYVDEVVIFNEKTPYEAIKIHKPDIIVKGGDYHPSDVVGKDMCEVVIFNYIDGYSTTKTLQDISSRRWMY